MATEINCSCEITENEVTICYPPISSGGGGGIGGGGTLNFIAKFTPDGSTIGDSRFFESSTESWVKNSLLNKTFDFENAIVNSKAGFKSIDANLHELFDGDEDIAITYSETERKLWKKNGDLVLNWQDEMLYPTAVGVHGVYERTSIRDSVNGYVLYDLSTNSTKDSTNNVSANFESRVLTNSSGTGVFDWQNELISSLGGNVTLAELAILGSTQAAGGGTRVLTTDNAGTVSWAAGGGGGTTTNPLTIGSGLSGTSFDGSAAVTIQNQLITGLAGGQTIAFGTAATDKGVFKATTGNKTVAETSTYRFLSGNNGAQELLRIGDGPTGLGTNELGMHAVGQSSTTNYLLRAGTNFTYINAGTDLRLQVGGVNYINMLSGAGTVAIQKPVTFATGANVTLVAGSTTVAPLVFTGGGTYKTTPAAGSVEYNGQFSMTPTDATRRFVTLAASSTKVTAAAPYTNDGYIVLNINGTDVHVMTTT
jgi:hypothetical protein